MKEYYLIGSLRNQEVVHVGNKVREAGFRVFDDWLAPGPEADDMWKSYEKSRGHSYAEALEGYAAQHVFEFDKYHLDRTDGAILLMPAGKSGFMELGYVIGTGKPGFIVYPEGEPDDRYDVMFLFANKVCFSVEELVDELKQLG